MKDRIRTLLIGIALISLFLLATGDVLAKKAKNNSTLFTGESSAYPDPFSFVFGWGEYTCPGGEASVYPYGPYFSGGTLTPCSAGSNFHMRDREMVFQILVPDPEKAPLVEGIMTMLVNWNWRYESETTYPGGNKAFLYSGPMWGTFKVDLETGEGATWEGTMTGNWDGENNIATWSMVGHGNGGDIDGMQIKTEFVGGVFGGDIQGRILRPGSAPK